jgi:hypothetical protein
MVKPATVVAWHRKGFKLFFLRNHMHESLAIDFAVVPTITFEIIHVFFVLSVDRRKILHFNVTKHPTAPWTA